MDKGQHDVIRKGIEILVNLAHRGACGCDPETGDGAGILDPDPCTSFFVRECASLGFSLPEPGTYGGWDDVLCRSSLSKD